VGRCFDPSRIARTSARTCAGAHLLSALHPAFAQPSCFAEKEGGLALRLQCALAAFAYTLLTTAAAAQEAPATLSSGRAFAEQGGAAIYANVCAACHQPHAKGAAGAGAYPALAGNSHLASADAVLWVVIRGQKDMPALGGMMSDEQVADVVNYVRSHFGNDYRDRVSAAMVHAARPQSPGP
jgi:mono/diheme cytochrome c family protein